MRYLDIYILLMLCAMWKKTKTDNKQKQMKTCQTHISYLQHTTLVEKNIFWKNKWSIYKSSYLVCRLLWSRILEIFISIIGLSDYVICYTSSTREMNSTLCHSPPSRGWPPRWTAAWASSSSGWGWAVWAWPRRCPPRQSLRLYINILNISSSS